MSSRSNHRVILTLSLNEAKRLVNLYYSNNEQSNLNVETEEERM